MLLELLSAIVIFRTRQSPLFESRKLEYSCQGQWLVMLQLYVGQYEYRCRETVAHAIFLPNTWGTSGFTLRDADKSPKRHSEFTLDGEREASKAEKQLHFFTRFYLEQLQQRKSALANVILVNATNECN